MTPEILTHSGRIFNFLEPDKHDYQKEDIAHGLGNICRFNGHCSPFYSVAQHSVIVSYLVPFRHALHAVLHDAEEAYVGDMTTPLKNLLPDFKRIADPIQRAIYRHFGLDEEMPEDVGHADLRALKLERHMLFPEHVPGEFHITKGLAMPPLEMLQRALTPNQAKDLFLARLDYLLEVRQDAQSASVEASR